MECVWCECRQHSACLGIGAVQCNVSNAVACNVDFCSSCLSHLPAAMPSYNNQSQNNAKLQETR